MKKLKISLFASLILVILLLIAVDLVNAETTTPPAQTESEWYVQIVDGTLLNSMDEQTESIIVPREISIVSKSEALMDSSLYHLIAPNQKYQDVRNYINNNLKLHPEEGVKVTGIAVSNKVFKEWLEFNKQQTEIWGPYDQIKIENEKLYLIYQQIEENLKSNHLYIRPESYVNIIELKIIVGGKDYFLKLDTIIVNDTVKFDDFLLNGTNDVFTVSELNKNSKEKQINVTLVTEKPSLNNGFFLKDITMIKDGTSTKVDLPFKQLKAGQFEIKDDILYSAILKAENLPPRTNAYYYLPQGFVVFPDENGKIQVNFFRKGTTQLPSTYGKDENFEGYDFLIRDSRGWISATCSCNCKTLFKDPAAIRTTATEIKEIYLGENADFYYATGKGMIDLTEPINHIRSFGAKNAMFSSSKFSTARTHIIFDENWNLRFVGRGSTSSSKGATIKEDEIPHFFFNGVEILFSQGIGAINTQLTFTSKAQGNLGNSESYITGKAAIDEKAPRKLIAVLPGEAPYSAKLVFLNAATKEIDERTIETQPDVENQYAKIKETIKQAKEFEKNLTSIEIEIPTPVSPTPPEMKKSGTNIKPQSGVKDTCSKYYPAFKCYSFPTDIPISEKYGKITTNNIKEQIYTFKYPFASLKEPNPQGQQDWQCVISPSCNNNWCCPNGNNVRCCKNPGYKKPCWGVICSSFGGTTSSLQSPGKTMISIPNKGDRILIITYRPETGQPNFYDLDKEYKEVARYDPKLGTLELVAQFQTYIDANPKAEKYWKDLMGWFEFNGGEKYLKNLMETYCYDPTGTSIVSRYYYYGKTKEPMFCTDSLPSPTTSKTTPIPKTIEPNYPKPDDTYVYLKYPFKPFTEIPPLPKVEVKPQTITKETSLLNIIRSYEKRAPNIVFSKETDTQGKQIIKVRLFYGQEFIIRTDRNYITTIPEGYMSGSKDKGSIAILSYKFYTEGFPVGTFELKTKDYAKYVLSKEDIEIINKRMIIYLDKKDFDSFIQSQDTELSKKIYFIESPL